MTLIIFFDVVLDEKLKQGKLATKTDIFDFVRNI